MVYIFAATMKEAKPLIKRFSLIKIKNEKAFEIYTNSEASINCIDDPGLYFIGLKSICLIITGIGQMNAATAAGVLLACGKLGKSDYVLNIGIAAGNSNTEIGKTYIINKIYFPEQNKYFFPRNYLTRIFCEAELYSGMVPIQNFSEVKEDEPLLYDMEAAGIFNAIIHVMTPDRIIFIKTVSDHGTDELKKSPDKIKKVINNFPNENIIRFTELLSEKSAEDYKALESEDMGSENLDGMLLEINGTLRKYNYKKMISGSDSMEHEISKLVDFANEEGIPVEDMLKKMIIENILPVKTRADGKKLLAEIKNNILLSL